MNYPNFMEAVLKGRVTDLEEIDDWIDAWHTTNTGVEKLHDYLGMTWEEYGLWLCHPSGLESILKDRRNK